jgi:hypothetical protein
MGLKGSSTCSVILDNARVPVDNLLGQIGRGHEIAFNILNIGRFKLGAGDLGACKVCVTESARYALQRKQFGQAIANFDAIKSKIANMTVLTYALDGVIYRTVSLIDQAIESLNRSDARYYEKVVEAIERYAIEASITKVYGSEALFFCSDNGIQIYGGYGFSEEYPMAAVFRDNRVDRLFEGTNEINRQIITGYFLKKALMEELPIRVKIDGLDGTIMKGISATSGALAEEQTSLEWMKALVLYTFNEAICRYGQDLKNHHQIGESFADIFTLLYAFDSMHGRISQLNRPQAVHRAIARVFAAESAVRIQALTRYILCACAEGSDLPPLLDVHLKMSNNMNINADTFHLKREIAEYVYENGKYPF